MVYNGPGSAQRKNVKSYNVKNVMVGCFVGCLVGAKVPPGVAGFGGAHVAFDGTFGASEAFVGFAGGGGQIILLARFHDRVGDPNKIRRVKCFGRRDVV